MAWSLKPSEYLVVVWVGNLNEEGGYFRVLTGMCKREIVLRFHGKSMTELETQYHTESN